MILTQSLVDYTVGKQTLIYRSVNEVICHGIPDTRALQDGDIVNIDITVFKNGYHGDLNETFLVGNVAPEYKKLIRATYESLDHAIKAVKPGVACRDFGTSELVHFSLLSSLFSYPQNTPKNLY